MPCFQILIEIYTSNDLKFDLFVFRTFLYHFAYLVPEFESKTVVKSTSSIMMKSIPLVRLFVQAYLCFLQETLSFLCSTTATLEGQ